MKKVAFLTTFYEATSGYSVIGVTETMIRAMLDHGYEPIVFVQENFTEPPEPSIWRKEKLDLRKVVPGFPLQGGLHDDFEKRVSSVETMLNEQLKGVDVCIAQDLILLDYYKEHNVALRRVAPNFPNLLWLHWMHSCPGPSNERHYPQNCRYEPPPGYIVYPNDSDKPVVCRSYRLGQQEWRVKVSRFGHAIDPLRVWQYEPMTLDLAKGADLLNGDVTAVYPARLDRGKQPEKVIRLMKGVQKAGYEPRLLIIDWQSAGERFQKYIDELLGLVKSMHIEGKVNFTSRLDDRCSQGVPRKVVQELMDLSNVYIHPSAVETYSLVVHEAILRGKLACLNGDFPAMRELFGDTGIYFDFGSDRTTRKYEPSEQAFWNDEALRLVAELKNNRALWSQTVARREWTPGAMFKQFEPLLYLQPVQGEGEWR